MNIKLQRKSSKALAVGLIGVWSIFALVGLMVAYALAFTMWIVVLEGGAFLPTFLEVVGLAESVIGIQAPRWFYVVAFVAYLPMLGIAAYAHYGSKKNEQLRGGLKMRRKFQYLRHRLDPTVGYAKFEDRQLPPVVELAHGVTLAAAVGSLLTNLDKQ